VRIAMVVSTRNQNSTQRRVLSPYAINADLNLRKNIFANPRMLRAIPANKSECLTAHIVGYT
jgi:hypothetical protein